MADPAEPDRREAIWISRVVASDDHDAFASLVRLHQSAVRGFLRRLTAPDWSRADDLAQETFWKGYRHLASYEGRGRFVSWLFRIAWQLFITEERRRRGVSLVPLDADLPGDDASQVLAARRTFDELLEQLHPAERAAVVLHYRHACTHAEIADTLHVPLGTVKTLIRRARIRLQQSQGAPIER